MCHKSVLLTSQDGDEGKPIKTELFKDKTRVPRVLIDSTRNQIITKESGRDKIYSTS